MYGGPHLTRLRFMTVVIGVLWCLLLWKVTVIQWVEHEKYRARAEKQRIRPVTLKARRGCILDRNGIPLALTVSSASYEIRPGEMKDVSRAARLLSAATGKSVSHVMKLLTSKRKYCWLVRQADDEVCARLDGINLRGVRKICETRRCYPFGKVGAHVLGYCNVDGKGIEGCELFADDELSGRDGRSIQLIDGTGKAALSLERPVLEPEDGLDVRLTIDWRIQEITDEELEQSVESLDAVWGGAVVLDPVTGEVLAMSNVPSFDPNRPASFEPEVRRNRIVTDMVEPGSTFKVVTFIEALESGVLDEDDPVDCENGVFRIGRHTIRDSHKMETVPAREVLIHSSNIGAVKIAEKIGKKRLYERARLLGFGSVTGIDVPDETKGRLPNPRTWSNMSLPTISFGYGVAVSPIQLAMCYAAVANGGMLVRPHIIKEVVGSESRRGQKVSAQVIRRAMEREIAGRMERLLCEVVESGTGRNASLPNVRIAGKTGTAKRVKKGGRGYEEGRYVSSFVGYITDRRPKLLCLVMIDGPKGMYYGSQVAAPVFRRIMNRILNMGDSPVSDPVVVRAEKDGERVAVLPDLKGREIRDAVEELRRLGFRPAVVGDSTAVAFQSPGPGTKLPKEAEVTLFSDSMPVEKGNRVRVPRVQGKTVREAIQYLVQAHLEVNVTGTGIVRKQTPPPGTLVDHGTVCLIVCEK